VVNVWRWIAGIGAVFALVRVVALIWVQIDLPNTPFGSSALTRWQTAMEPLTLVALGLLVVTAAFILREVEARRQSN
jgi:hypothetical protein